MFTKRHVYLYTKISKFKTFLSLLYRSRIKKLALEEGCNIISLFSQFPPLTLRRNNIGCKFPRISQFAYNEPASDLFSFGLGLCKSVL